MEKTVEISGKINRIAGPVVGAIGIGDIRLHDMVMVGDEHLVGEVIRLNADEVTIQVYEDTSGLRMGEPIFNTREPLVAYLGPGLMGQIFDGLQRPLSTLAKKEGGFLGRGVSESPLDEEKIWQFTPLVKAGDAVKPGSLLGEIPETATITHRVLVPAGLSGTVKEVHSGDLTIRDIVAVIETEEKELVKAPLAHR